MHCRLIMKSTLYSNPIRSGITPPTVQSQTLGLTDPLQWYYNPMGVILLMSSIMMTGEVTLSITKAAAFSDVILWVRPRSNDLAMLGTFPKQYFWRFKRFKCYITIGFPCFSGITEITEILQQDNHHSFYKNKVHIKNFKGSPQSLQQNCPSILSTQFLFCYYKGVPSLVVILFHHC